VPHTSTMIGLFTNC